MNKECKETQTWQRGGRGRGVLVWEQAKNHGSALLVLAHSRRQGLKLREDLTA